MKLLFDQNLSPRLVQRLADLYPGSIHVRHVGLHSADDEAVWAYARDLGFTIVSKDSDFRQFSFLRGHPPKIVWIWHGNCSTGEIQDVLRRHRDELLAFEQAEEGSFLALG